MKKISLFLLFFSFVLPIMINAKTDDDLLEVTKYYKTMFYSSSFSILSNSDNSMIYTLEITEEEYNNGEFVFEKNASSIIETTYKKMTTSISANGSYYRYKNTLNWKNNPKIRSYDTIGIGFYSSVKPISLYFSQKYCYSLNDCYNNTNFTGQIFSSGASATFKLPVGDFISLSQTFYFDVEKKADVSILKQVAIGDYAHATKNVAKNSSTNFFIDTNGINLNSDIIDYYDEINYAKVSWSGSW